MTGAGCRARTTALAVTFALAACGPAPTPDVAAPAPPAANAPVVAPAQQPATPIASHPIVDFTGVAGVPFGSAPDAVAAAWKQPLVAGEPLEDIPGACRHLHEADDGAGHWLGFMIEDEKFVRFETDRPDLLAPGGGRVGDTRAALRERYAGRFEEQPHQYSDGIYFIVAPAEGGANRLVFEVTADAGDRATQWRIGLDPQVHYVEGCA